MAGSFLLVATVLCNSFWAGFLLAVRPGQFLAGHDGQQRLNTVRGVLTVPFMLVAGLLIDLWGAQTTALLGSSLAAIGFLLLDRGTSRWPAIAAVALLAGGSATLITASAMMMPSAFFPTHAARSVNLGFLAVFAGTVVSPHVVRLIASRLYPQRTLLALALASIVSATAVAITPVDEFQTAFVGEEQGSSLADVRLALAALAIFLCAPLEQVFAPWAKRYPSELGYHGLASALIGLGFWLAFVSARLWAGLTMPANYEAVWLLALALLLAIVGGNVLSAYGRRLTMLGIWLAGACCGPLVPTLLGFVIHTFPGNSGIAIGFVCAAGAIGNELIAPILDVSNIDSPSKSALRGVTVLSALFVVPALVLALVGL